MSPESVDVLVLDGESKQSLTTIRSVARAGYSVGTAVGSTRLPAVCNSSRYVAFRRVVCDYAEDPIRYAEDVVALVHHYGIKVVVSAMDASASALIPYREQLRRVGAVLAVGSDDAVAVAHDKERTLATATALGVPIPRGTSVSSPEQVPEALDAIGFPIVVKPATSWASSTSQWTPRSVIVNSESEAITAIMASLNAGSAALVQEYLPGVREQIHAFAVGGKVIVMTAVLVHRCSPILGGVSTLRESIALPEDAAEYARRLIEGIGLDGPSEVEYRRAADGRPVLMEINARISGSLQTTVLAGVDLPVLLVDWALGNESRPAEGYRKGVRLRDLELELRWLVENLKGSTEPDAVGGGEAVRQFVKDSIRRAHYDYIDHRDPVPAFTHVVGSIMRALRKFGRLRGAHVSARV